MKEYVLLPLNSIGELRALAVVAVLGVALAIPGCARDAETSGGHAAGGLVVEKVPETPRALGEAIGKTYQEMLAEFATLVDGNPEPATVSEKVADLKGRTVQKMLAWGRLRDVLAAADRKVVDAATLSTLKRTDKAHWQAFTDATNHYRTLDNGLANTIASLNIVTQYAAFELLKEQSPDEARRLGIE